MASDNEDHWAKQQELYQLDFQNGYAAYMDNDPDRSSDAARETDHPPAPCFRVIDPNYFRIVYNSESKPTEC